MRGQVIRGGQTDNPGDMPLQLRRFAERQASVIPAPPPARAGLRHRRSGGSRSDGG